MAIRVLFGALMLIVSHSNTEKKEDFLISDFELITLKKGETLNFLTGSADSTCKIWDCRTGTIKTNYVLPNPVRTCGFSYSGNLILYSTDRAMSKECNLFVRDIREPGKLFFPCVSDF
jgi:WD40 repeat protein